jgi:integrase
LRKARDAARLTKAGGIDPVQARKVDKLKATNPAGDTFRVVAWEWFDKQSSQWSEAHAQRAKRQFERDLLPWLGERKLADIEPVELLATLRKVEQRGAIETADRGLMLARQVWRYGVATGRVPRDITADLKGALSPYRGKHFAAITDPAKLGELIRPFVRIGAGLSCAQPCNWPPCCSSARGNCGGLSGPRLTWTAPCGPFRRRA